MDESVCLSVYIMPVYSHFVYQHTDIMHDKL